MYMYMYISTHISHSHQSSAHRRGRHERTGLRTYDLATQYYHVQVLVLCTYHGRGACGRAWSGMWAWMGHGRGRSRPARGEDARSAVHGTGYYTASSVEISSLVRGDHSVLHSESRRCIASASKFCCYVHYRSAPVSAGDHFPLNRR